MPRELPEWIGKNDNDPVPDRVRTRVFIAFNGVCCECGLKITGKRWICDHRIALINGGDNRENNLGPIHESCDKTKTAADKDVKAKTYAMQKMSIGLRSRGPKIKSAGFRRTPAQRSASRPLERRS